MSQAQRGAIGILGGMGPLATVDMFEKIVNLTKAESDQEHIRIYIDNHAPMPDRGTFINGRGEDPLPYMVESIEKLEQIGSTCIVMPCNTAHFFLPRLREHIHVRFFDMMEETAKTCLSRYPGKTAGILGTSHTIESGLYRDALTALGVKSVDPDEAGKTLLMEHIFGYKAGRRFTDPADALALMARMKAAGADYFILGCTELPLLARDMGLDEEFIDAAVETACAAIEYCGYPVNR